MGRYGVTLNMYLTQLIVCPPNQSGGFFMFVNNSKQKCKQDNISGVYNLHTKCCINGVYRIRCVYRPYATVYTLDKKRGRGGSMKAENILTASSIPLNPVKWIPYILFVIIAFFVVGIGQSFKNKIAGHMPGFIDGNIEPLTNMPMQSVAQTRFY